MEPISPSTGQKCSPAHYLAEVAITRKAQKLRKVLPDKFWNTDEWKRDYKTQIMAAHSLLKIFPIEVIIAALNTKECSWMYSLNTKQIPIVCQQEMKRIEMEQKIAKTSKPIEYDSDNVQQVPVVRPKNSMANKLRKLDG